MTSHAETAERLRRRLADQLEAEGELRSASWRSAVERVPREIFLGGQIYRPDGAAGRASWEAIKLEKTGAREWLSLAYEDRTWVTQIGGRDRAPGDGPVEGAPSSSSTLPSLVVRMLEDLDVRDGDRILEIGTGTGYSTALMCQRLGEANVTSIEVDPNVAERARTALAEAGYEPTLVTGDGLAGHPPGAPYDRIIATCSVRTVPEAWLAQCRPRGRILSTLAGWLYGSAYVSLEVTEPGYALGRFMPGTVSFMIARSHAAPTLTELPAREGTERKTLVGADLFDDWMGRFLAQLAAPSACRVVVTDDDGCPAHGVVDMSTRAYAWVQQGETGVWSVLEGGPASLWDAVERTVRAWRDAGRPKQEEFTLSVTPDAQTVHLHVGDVERAWPLPARPTERSEGSA